jgi:hypothetical protein
MDTMLDDEGAAVLFPAAERDFLLSKTSRPNVQPTHPPFQRATEALSATVKLPEGETEHSI